ncbi:MAG: YgiQ family radical SAM protein, partial [Clostridia bacterium]|nr:YgiQ family radical SAM protein [Clostridia bacterium]
MFLPTTQADLAERGISQLDVVLVTGDAYVDHPSFGTAIIGRVLEDAGFSVGIIAQPDWHSTRDFLRLGLPRLGFLCNSGNIDSMVNHYTAARRRRSDDAYTPGGKAGRRPDRAVIVYSNRIREAAPGVPLLIGGIEASLRRFAHYDYWDDAVRRSILVDSGADLLMYGMGELSVVEIARRLDAGEPISSIDDVCGTCVMVDYPLGDGIILPDFDTICVNKKAYASATATQYREQDAVRGKPLYQQHGPRFVRQNPPMRPLTTEEFDHVYELPYENAPHPSYAEEGGVPAIAEVEFSIIQNRGCFGACNFCALTLHQSRTVTCRSKESIVREARRLTESPHFKGYIHDIGGPTANFRAPACRKQLRDGVCPDRRCLAPEPCPAREVDHGEYLDILREVRELPRVKKVFVRSGLRFDYMLLDRDDTFFRELVQHHVSGQLKVAPEHISDNVLKRMGKPGQAVFDRFCEQYFHLNKVYGKEQY